MNSKSLDYLELLWLINWGHFINLIQNSNSFMKKSASVCKKDGFHSQEGPGSKTQVQADWSILDNKNLIFKSLILEPENETQIMKARQSETVTWALEVPEMLERC